MRKITAAVILLFASIVNGYSQNEIVDLGSLDYAVIYVYDNSCYYVEVTRGNKFEYLKLPRNSYHKNEYGYMDLGRQHLFCQNNRVKTMKVEDLENNLVYTLHFKDYVYLHDLVFEKPSRHIKLTIQEV